MLESITLLEYRIASISYMYRINPSSMNLRVASLAMGQSVISFVITEHLIPMIYKLAYFKFIGIAY